jgi:hypothetical protein
VRPKWEGGTTGQGAAGGGGAAGGDGAVAGEGTAVGEGAAAGEGAATGKGAAVVGPTMRRVLLECRVPTRREAPPREGRPAPWCTAGGWRGCALARVKGLETQLGAPAHQGAEEQPKKQGRPLGARIQGSPVVGLKPGAHE